MVNMDVEMHSPTRKSRLSKRARSPEDQVDSDRPPKRVSLGFGDSLPAPFAQPLPAIQLDPNLRHPSDDWVTQTGGLRIHSPALFSGPINEVLHEEVVSERIQSANMVFTDDSMTLDTEESISNEASRRHVLDAKVQHQQPALLCNPGQTPSPHARDSSLPDSQQYPSFLTLPSQGSSLLTPTSSQFKSAAEQNQVDTQATQGSSTFAAFATAPASPNTTSITTHPGKKQRFTMGPRADCEKCRLGVKGHWMHFDEPS